MSEKKDTMMNEELRQWINETKKDITKKTKDKKPKKPKGLCQICGQKPAVVVCLKCGRNVCKTCHFKLIGICKKCVPSEIATKWDGSRPDWEKELGVKWIG